MAGKRTGALAAAVVAAVMTMGALMGPAAYADDPSSAPDSIVTTTEETVATDTPPVVSDAPVAEETTSNETTPAEKPAAADSEADITDQTPSQNTSTTDEKPAAPVKESSTVSKQSTSTEAPAETQEPEFVPTASIAEMEAVGYESAGARGIDVFGSVDTNVDYRHPEYVVTVQVTTCMGNPSDPQTVTEAGGFYFEFSNNYPDGPCLVSAQALINGSPAGEAHSTTVTFAPEEEWTPQSNPVMYPVECSVNGEPVKVGIEFDYSHPEEDYTVDIFDGEPIEEITWASPGETYTYGYHIWRVAFPDDVRIVTKTLAPVELCDVANPSAQVTSISASAIDEGDARSVNVTGTVELTDVENLADAQVIVSDNKGHTSAPLAVDANGKFSTVLTGEFADGVYTISAQAYLKQSGEAVPSGTAKSTTVEFKTVEVPATVFTPQQPTFEALECVEGAPQTRVVFPVVDPANGYYTVDGEKASGTVVVPGVVRVGFQFADGVVPPKGWAGLDGFTPKQCQVVTPPVDTEEPPVDNEKPPVKTDDGHKSPSKVETDGNTLPLVLFTGLAGALALLLGGGAVREGLRRRAIR